MRILALSLIALTASANVLTASSPDQVNQFRESNKDDVASLLFYTPRSKGPLSLFGLFTKEETDSDFEARVAEVGHLMKVDVTNPDLAEVKEFYQIEETPRLISWRDGKLVIDEKPTPETEEKIKDLIAQEHPDIKPGPQPGVTKVSNVEVQPKPATQPKPTKTEPTSTRPKQTQTQPKTAVREHTAPPTVTNNHIADRPVRTSGPVRLETGPGFRPGFGPGPMPVATGLVMLNTAHPDMARRTPYGGEEVWAGHEQSAPQRWTDQRGEHIRWEEEDVFYYEQPPQFEEVERLVEVESWPTVAMEFEARPVEIEAIEYVPVGPVAAPFSGPIAGPIAAPFAGP